MVVLEWAMTVVVIFQL